MDDFDRHSKKRLQPQEFVEWDVRNWSEALNFWVEHTNQDISTCTALELGSRHGRLSLWLALQGARVLCSDVGQPSKGAIQEHQARGVSNLIQYESIDATRIPYTNQFDLVVFKSMLGALGESAGKAAQARAIAEMHKALKKGGELFFAENLIASPLHQTLRRRFVQWGIGWRYVSMEEMHEFLSPFSRVQYRTLGFAGAFGRGEMLRNVLGILDQAILSRLLPEKWRYITVGVATK